MINYETLKAIQEIEVAKTAVEPAVGKLTMSFDSADQVYVRALKQLGYSDAIKLRGQGRAAQAMFTAVRGRPAPAPRIAQDSTARSAMFPHAARLSRV